MAIAGAAWAAFPQDPPNDPNFATAESDPPATTCLTKSGDDQQHYLFSKIPQCTPNAQDAEGSAGMFVDRAWRDFTTGNPQTTIAYIEGGINWHAGDAPEFANKVFLNAGELPPPTTPLNDGVLNAATLRHGRQQRQRDRRPRGHHRPLLERQRRRPERLDRRRLGLGLLQRPERPGDDRLHL